LDIEKDWKRLMLVMAVEISRFCYYPKGDQSRHLVKKVDIINDLYCKH